MRQTTKAHRACHAPQILSVKSDYFPKEKEERTGFAKDQTATLNVKSASRNNKSRKSQRADANGRRSGRPRRVLSPGTPGDDPCREIRTRDTTRFRSFGAQIESDVAQGQHEPDAYSAFELDQIQRSKLHGIQQAPASSPRVNLVSHSGSVASGEIPSGRTSCDQESIHD